MSPAHLLRPLALRLTSTPVKELPQIASFLASSLSACVEQHNAGEEQTVLLHKVKTRVSSLLQDRSAEGRLTAIILIKALVEAGGYDVLSTAEPWVRGLIGVLNKPDPVAAKKLCILTITRILILTHAYPTLVREISTPLLPAFITATLNAIRPRQVTTEGPAETVLSPLLHVVLRSWCELLPRHPSVFRPFVSRFKPICLSLMSDSTISDAVLESAETLFIALCHCAPKNGAAAEWTQLVSQTIDSAHATLDQVFRAVVEDWISTDSSFRNTASTDFSTPPRITRTDSLGLYEWSGVHAGSRRLVTLVTLLQNVVRVPTVHAVTFPLGPVVDLLTRLNSVVVPTGVKSASPRLKPEASRDEYEELWSELPSLHVASLELLSALVESFSSLLLPGAKALVEQLVWVFDAEHVHPDIRVAAYELAAALTPLLGPSMSPPEVDQLAQIVRVCCADLTRQEKSEKPAKPQNSSQSHTKTHGATPLNVDSFLDSSAKKRDPSLDSSKSAIRDAAHQLLPVLFQHLPARSIPTAWRTQMDRTAILTQHKEAMLASVLNPASGHPGQQSPASIMPFLAQAFSADPDVEALLRPRMPVLRNSLGGEDGPDGVDEVSDVQEEGRDHEAGINQLTGLMSPQETSLDNGTNQDVVVNSDIAMAESIHPDGPLAAAEGLMHHTTVKRSFAEMEQHADLAAKTAEDASLSVAAPEKRVRMDHMEQLATISSQTMQVPGTTTQAMAEPQIGVQDETRRRVHVPPPNQIRDTEREQLRDDGSSEDSEIPPINADLDTEDEEDDEDDEDDDEAGNA